MYDVRATWQIRRPCVSCMQSATYTHNQPAPPIYNSIIYRARILLFRYTLIRALHKRQKEAKRKNRIHLYCDAKWNLFLNFSRRKVWQFTHTHSYIHRCTIYTRTTYTIHHTYATGTICGTAKQSVASDRRHALAGSKTRSQTQRNTQYTLRTPFSLFHWLTHNIVCGGNLIISVNKFT